MTAHHLPPDGAPHDDDGGLAAELRHRVSRRSLMSFVGAGGLSFLAACTSDRAETSSSATTDAPAPNTTPDGGSATTTAPPDGLPRGAAPGSPPPEGSDGGDTTPADPSGGDCEPVPAETAGPFPGDGSNGPDALGHPGVVRRDIRAGFGDSTTVAPGVPLTIRMKLADNANGCAPLAGAAVYVWHCDRDGGYSMYSNGIEDENYLRGVQEADAHGELTFTSIFPGCYPGRWPHIHYEVYPSLADARRATNRLRTSQIALPEDVCSDVYATAGYESSADSFSRVSLATDMVFSDGADLQIPSANGSATAVTIDMPVAV